MSKSIASIAILFDTVLTQSYAEEIELYFEESLDSIIKSKEMDIVSLNSTRPTRDNLCHIDTLSIDSLEETTNLTGYDFVVDVRLVKQGKIDSLQEHQSVFHSRKHKGNIAFGSSDRNHLYNVVYVLCALNSDTMFKNNNSLKNLFAQQYELEFKSGHVNQTIQFSSLYTLRTDSFALGDNDTGDIVRSGPNLLVLKSLTNVLSRVLFKKVIESSGSKWFSKRMLFVLGTATLLVLSQTPLGKTMSGKIIEWVQPYAESVQAGMEQKGGWWGTIADMTKKVPSMWKNLVDRLKLFKDKSVEQLFSMLSDKTILDEEQENRQKQDLERQRQELEKQKQIELQAKDQLLASMKKERNEQLTYHNKLSQFKDRLLRDKSAQVIAKDRVIEQQLQDLLGYYRSFTEKSWQLLSTKNHLEHSEQQLQLLHKEQHHLKQQLIQLQAEKQDLLHQQQQKQNLLGDLRGDIHEKESQMKLSLELLQTTQQELARQTRAVTNLESKVNELELEGQKLQQALEKKAALEQRLTEQQTALESAKVNLKNLEKDKTELEAKHQKQLEALRIEYESARQTTKNTVSRETRVRYENEKRTLIDEHNAAMATLADKAEKEQSQLLAEIAKQKQEVLSLKASVKAKDQEIDQLQSVATSTDQDRQALITQLREQLTQTQNQKDRLYKQLEELEAELETNKQSIGELKQEKMTLQEEIRLLQVSRAEQDMMLAKVRDELTKASTDMIRMQAEEQQLISTNRRGAEEAKNAQTMLQRFKDQHKELLDNAKLRKQEEELRVQLQQQNEAEQKRLEQEARMRQEAADEKIRLLKEEEEAARKKNLVWVVGPVHVQGSTRRYAVNGTRRELFETWNQEPGFIVFELWRRNDMVQATKTLSVEQLMTLVPRNSAQYLYPEEDPSLLIINREHRTPNNIIIPLRRYWSWKRDNLHQPYSALDVVSTAMEQQLIGLNQETIDMNQAYMLSQTAKDMNQTDATVLEAMGHLSKSEQKELRAFVHRSRFFKSSNPSFKEMVGYTEPQAPKEPPYCIHIHEQYPATQQQLLTLFREVNKKSWTWALNGVAFVKQGATIFLLVVSLDYFKNRTGEWSTELKKVLTPYQSEGWYQSILRKESYLNHPVE